jgi:hypothetical protein
MAHKKGHSKKGSKHRVKPHRAKNPKHAGTHSVRGHLAHDPSKSHKMSAKKSRATSHAIGAVHMSKSGKAYRRHPKTGKWVLVHEHHRHGPHK